MLQMTSCVCTLGYVMGLSMDVRRLLGLICVSETVVYAQINRFREQINAFT